MRRILLLAAVLLGVTQQSIAQDYEYIPLVREGVKWVCAYKISPKVECSFTLELKGDSVINGKTYKVMHKYSGEEINPENDTIPVFLREENKIVYGIVPDGKTYPDCPVGIEGETAMTEKIQNGEEFILYDFNDFPAFIKSFESFSYSPYSSLVITDNVTINGKKAKRYILNNGTCICAIEGIGYDGILKGATLALLSYEQGRVNLSHVIENGEVIYWSEKHKPRQTNEEYLPVIREGVQWVNEKVTIDHGDTTYSYYNYEFKGNDRPGNSVCYRYSGKSMDDSLELSVAARFSMRYDAAYNSRVYPIYSCNLLERVIEEGRSIITDFTSDELLRIYSFGYTTSDIEYNYTPNFYIYYDRGIHLTRENLVEVQPVTIEGITCSRFAYLSEQGDTLAYVVEGIGYDSRDMGDLLTPFTRKPDPTDDHQEYWGLSHVIKDGQIIYKGMRYRPEAVEGLKGDVNRDGKMNIEDVTVLIDHLLGSTTPAFNINAADVDCDSVVSIADVTALIDLLLNSGGN